MAFRIHEFKISAHDFLYNKSIMYRKIKKTTFTQDETKYPESGFVRNETLFVQDLKYYTYIKGISDKFYDSQVKNRCGYAGNFYLFY